MRCNNRFRRWVASGGMARLFALLTADPQFEEVRRVLSIRPPFGPTGTRPGPAPRIGKREALGGERWAPRVI